MNDDEIIIDDFFSDLQKLVDELEKEKTSSTVWLHGAFSMPSASYSQVKTTS